MVACRAPWVKGRVLEHGAHVSARPVELLVTAAAERGRAAGGQDEPEQSAQSGALPGTVGPKETGDAPGFDLEAEALDSLDLAELLVQIAYLDGCHGRRMMTSRPFQRCPTPPIAGFWRSGDAVASVRAGPPTRRDLRAVPSLLRGALAPRRRRHRGGCGAGGARDGAHDPRGRRHPPGGGHGPRDRVVPQRALARLQDGRRRRPGSAGAVPAARGGDRGARSSRLGDGGPGGRRRPGRGGRACRRRRPSRAGADPDPRQGPGAVRDQGASRAARPPQPAAVRRRGRAREVRRGPGLDPRLAGARGRQRRRLPRPPRLGREVGLGRARPLRASRGDPGARDRLGRQRPRAHEAGRDAGGAARPRDAVPRSRHPSRRRARSGRWTSGDGAGRRPRWRSGRQRLGAPGIVERAAASRSAGRPDWGALTRPAAGCRCASRAPARGRRRRGG